MVMYYLCITQSGELSCLVSSVLLILFFIFLCCCLANFLFFISYTRFHAAKPAFYNYVIAMFVLNAIALCASGLAGIGTGFGLWYINQLGLEPQFIFT